MANTGWGADMDDNSRPEGFTSLYRIYGQDRSLLYVGISMSAFRRMSEHRASKGWWRETAFIRVEHFDFRHEAEIAEIRAIRSEKPIYNVAYNDEQWEAVGYLSPRLIRKLRERGPIPQGGHQVIADHGYQLPEDLWPTCSHCRKPQPPQVRFWTGLCQACYKWRQRHGTLVTRPIATTSGSSKTCAASPTAC